jgi:ribosomal protein L19E
METRHLRNAILKQLRENPEINDKTWRALVVEYVTREYDWVDPVGRRS